ncbi:hypothetical protein EJB05_47260, partial [Eragrostis curvula]
MAASSSAAASSSIVELDEAADLLDTATSAYFDDGDSAASGGSAAFLWPVAEKITSTLTGNGQLRSLCTLMKVPKEYKTFFAHSKPACEAPKEGTDAICVYADAFDAGMRLPLHDFHGAVLRHYGLAPSQLAPYAWRYMAAFVLLCADAGVEPQVPVFQHFFSIVTNKGDALGWHHFKPYLPPGGGQRRLFNGKMPRQEQELNATKNEIARLKKEHAAKEQELGRLGDELRVAKDAHAAEVSQLAEELEQAKANHAVDIAQLGEERAAEVQAVKVQCQREIISLQHNSVIEQSKRYVMGLRDMRQLAVATYPDVIKASDLQHQLLSRYPDQQGIPPQEGPLNE